MWATLFILISLFPAEQKRNAAMQNGSLQVTVTNLRSNKGHLLISVFNSSDGFPSNVNKAFRKQQVAISNQQAVINFADMPAGNYAVAILHDENDDGKMNSNFFGIPKEGYGFSNNVMGTFGPPSFSKASFACTSSANKSVSIRARY
jgi:uncharacterized protein (DUF2141 family)